MNEFDTLVCECNNPNCWKILPLANDYFLRLKSVYPESAIVMSGHEDLNDEILMRDPKFVVVKD